MACSGVARGRSGGQAPIKFGGEGASIERGKRGSGAAEGARKGRERVFFPRRRAWKGAVAGRAGDAAILLFSALFPCLPGHAAFFLAERRSSPFRLGDRRRPTPDARAPARRRGPSEELEGDAQDGTPWQPSARFMDTGRSRPAFYRAQSRNAVS